MKKLPLTKGYETMVDDEDFEYLNQWKWHAQCVGRKVYAARSQYMGTNENGKKVSKHISLHRLIMDVPKGKQIDHIDGDGLNNQKKNLRICTQAENLMNRRRMRKQKTSKYKGVYWFKGRKKWASQISVDGKLIHLGVFEDEDKAAKTYNRYAKFVFGEFAYLNKIEHPELLTKE